jgi:hypothetical protein
VEGVSVFSCRCSRCKLWSLLEGGVVCDREAAMRINNDQTMSADGKGNHSLLTHFQPCLSCLIEAL